MSQCDNDVSMVGTKGAVATAITHATDTDVSIAKPANPSPQTTVKHSFQALTLVNPNSV